MGCSSVLSTGPRSPARLRAAHIDQIKTVIKNTTQHTPLGQGTIYFENSITVYKDRHVKIYQYAYM